MVLSMGSGYMVSIMMAEDKEKRNLKSLILSGVTATEYTFSMLVLPLLIMLLGMILLPIYLKVDVSGYLFAYVIYLILATISMIFLNILIGAVSDTQSKAQVYSIFPMLIFSFLPVLAIQNETAQKLLDYSFIGPLVSLLKAGGGELSLRSLGLLLAWILLLGLASLFVLKNSYKGK